MNKAQRLRKIESCIDCNRDPKHYVLYPMLYSQIENQPKEMQEKLYVWKSWHVMCGPGMEVESIAIDSPLVKVIKILYKHYFDLHFDKNYYYNKFFEGIGMYSNGIISMELMTFYRAILRETFRNNVNLKSRDFPSLSQYGLPPKALDLTERSAKKRFIWFTLAYNAHQELECFDSLENYQAAMLIKDAASMVSIDAPEVLSTDASEVLPVDAIDASEVLPIDAIDTSEVLPVDAVNASEVIPVDAVNASEVLPVDAVDASEVIPVDAVDAYEVLPDDVVDASEMIPDDASEMMLDDAVEVLPVDASEVMPDDAVDAPEDNALQYMFLQKRYKDLQAKLLVLQANKPQDDGQQDAQDNNQGEDQEYSPADDQGEDQEYVPDDDQEDSPDEGQQYAPDNDQEMEEDPEKEEMDKKTALLAILNLRLIDMDRAIEPPPFPVAPRFKRCVALPQQEHAIVENTAFTSVEELMNESKIPRDKSYSQWLPLQRYPRTGVMKPIQLETVFSNTILQNMADKEIIDHLNQVDDLIDSAKNENIRLYIAKGKIFNALVFKAKQQRSRNRICDVYENIRQIMKDNSTRRSGVVSVCNRRMVYMRTIADAEEYLELDKYDYKCNVNDLFDRISAIVKEAKSLKPVVGKRPAVRLRENPAAKKQRVN